MEDIQWERVGPKLLGSNTDLYRSAYCMQLVTHSILDIVQHSILPGNASMFWVRNSVKGFPSLWLLAFLHLLDIVLVIEAFWTKFCNTSSQAKSDLNGKQKWILRTYLDAFEKLLD